LIFVDSYNDVLVLLGLAHFIPLLNCFDYSGRREMSAYLVNNVIGRSIKCPVYVSFVNTSAVDPNPHCFCRLNPDPEQQWEFGSGSKSAEITHKKFGKT
jgi:hypothetical protein